MTDEELDALVKLLRNHWLGPHDEARVADAITALRTQLAEANARADRAEAERAAQIEVDAEVVAFALWKAEADRAAPNVGRHRTQEMFSGELESTRSKWLHIAAAAITAIRAQPHDRTALDRMLTEAREQALREAIEAYPEGIGAILALIEKPDAT